MLGGDMGSQGGESTARRRAASACLRTRRFDLLPAERRSVRVALKQPAAVKRVLRHGRRADVLIEGFRPGVTERPGSGQKSVSNASEADLRRIQDGASRVRLAQDVGHDLN